MPFLEKNCPARKLSTVKSFNRYRKQYSQLGKTGFYLKEFINTEFLGYLVVDTFFIKWRDETLNLGNFYSLQLCSYSLVCFLVSSIYPVPSLQFSDSLFPARNTDAWASSKTALANIVWAQPQISYNEENRAKKWVFTLKNQILNQIREEYQKELITRSREEKYLPKTFFLPSISEVLHTGGEEKEGRTPTSLYYWNKIT